jgi:hypothetical protein
MYLIGCNPLSHPRRVSESFLVSLLILLGVACRPWADQPVRQEWRSLDASSTCSGRFLARELPHVTAANVERVGFYISNGSGLAVNDLDNDGDMDLVLANIFGPIQIFWNEGAWQFRPRTLFEGSARAVTTVDVDGDGWLDIVLAKRNGDIWYWRNTGADGTATDDAFVRDRLNGVQPYAYSLNWGDLDADGDLDLVTASYDATLEKQHGDQYKESGRAGVFVHTQEMGQFTSMRLADAAQALALELVDLNQDGRQDIWVGNDFDVRDYVWMAADDGWQPAEPFRTTTFSTMSLDVGDINNDGRRELFATDMHPYKLDRDMMLQWMPAMVGMEHDLPVLDETGKYHNVVTSALAESGKYIGANRYIAATGWSWSSKFGDLNQDGYLDLYVVNGMTALEIFSHLANDELVEENQVFENDGQGEFRPRSEWGLNSSYGGRGMSMADLDGDGDLDVVVNNLGAPSQLFENQLCEGESLLVDLRWPGSANTRAIGARLALHTSSGVYWRDVRASSGYLSGDPSQVHFGIPAGAELQLLQITWPDGADSTVRRPKTNHAVVVERK